MKNDDAPRLEDENYRFYHDVIIRATDENLYRFSHGFIQKCGTKVEIPAPIREFTSGLVGLEETSDGARDFPDTGARATGPKVEKHFILNCKALDLPHWAPRAGETSWVWPPNQHADERVEKGKRDRDASQSHPFLVISSDNCAYVLGTHFFDSENRWRPKYGTAEEAMMRLVDRELSYGYTLAFVPDIYFTDHQAPAPSVASCFLFNCESFVRSDDG